MKQVIKELLEIAIIDRSSSNLVPMENAIGRDRAVIVASKILDAVACGGLPEDVDRSWAWCKELEIVFLNWPDLGSIFALRGDKLEFAPGLGRDNQMEIQELVRSRYNPRLIV